MHLFVHTDQAKFNLDLPALATAGRASTLWIDHYAFEALTAGTSQHFQIEFFPNFVERHWQQYHFDGDALAGVLYSNMIPLPINGDIGFRTWPLGSLPPGTQKVQIHLRDAQGNNLDFDEADLWLRIE